MNKILEAVSNEQEAAQAHPVIKAAEHVPPTTVRTFFYCCLAYYHIDESYVYEPM